MKHLVLLILVLFFAACDEIGPVINTNPTVNPTTVEKRVIVEEFTGVTCVNCPEGSAKIEDLLAIHGDKLVAISIHTGFFASPYSDSNYDFRTPEGAELDSYLGPVSGYPAATVNRIVFDGEQERPLSLNKWAGYIAQELALAPKVGIEIAQTYTASNRNLSIDVDIEVLETITDATRLTVMITENDITDVQLTPGGKDYDYKHKHVLRDVLTNGTGNAITETMDAGAMITESFDITLPNDWVAEKCTVVAFVSLAGGDLNVLNVNEVHVGE